MIRHVKRLAARCLLAAAGIHGAYAGDPRLIEAVKNGDTELVRTLLRQRIDVNSPQGDGSTALHWAVYRDNLPLADLLIRSGAHVDAVNDDGTAPLQLACNNRHTAMVERLVAAGANVNARLPNGETALMTCARAGDAGSVKALLRRGAEVNAKESAHDQTALMWAAAEGHPDVVRLLLEAHADFRLRSRVYPETVVGEDTQRSGREKLNYTVMRGGFTALLFAARDGDVESAKILVAAGADVNDKLADGMSALVLAAHSGQGPVGIFLLSKDANPNAADTGYTALHAAVLRKDLPLVKALLASGANPNAHTTKGTPIRRQTTDFNLPATLIGATPYLLAAKFLEPDIMRALVAGGADTKLTMTDGTTALMLAAGAGGGRGRNRRGISSLDVGGTPESESEVLEAVKAALDLGAEVDAANRAGDTALHSAAPQGYETVVQALADHGANINAKNKSGLTPLALASSGGRFRQRAAAAAGGDDVAAPPARPSGMAALLRKLGATE